jgi:hypothetical protein
MGMVFYFAAHSEIIPSVKEKSIEKLNLCGNCHQIMLTITEIEFFPDVVSEDVTISTIDVGEQMIAIGEVNFD